MICLFVGGQVYRNFHKLSYTLLPTSTEGCDANNVSLTFQQPIVNTPFPQHNDAENSIINISFSWYGVIGAIVVWILAIVLSHIVGPQDVHRTVEPNLISPLAQFMLPKTNRHIEMRAIGKSSNRIFNCDKKQPEEEGTTYVVR